MVTSLGNSLTPPYDTEDDPTKDIVSYPLSLEEERTEGFELPALRFPPLQDKIFFIADWILSTPLCLKYIDCAPYKAEDKIVGITREGRHVVWQQETDTSLPAAISMLALDAGQPLLSQEIQKYFNLSAWEPSYINQAGFEPLYHTLPHDAFEKIKILEGLLPRTGPLLLRIDPPHVNVKAVVLDTFSSKEMRLTLRDPYHGRIVTLQLFPFVHWIQSCIELRLT